LLAEGSVNEDVRKTVQSEVAQVTASHQAWLSGLVLACSSWAAACASAGSRDGPAFA